jgi:hypothetical protein
MAARDRYTISLRCPKCGKAGEANASEDDYPFMRKLHFSIDGVSDGFALTKLGENALTTEISCIECGEVAS